MRLPILIVLLLFGNFLLSQSTDVWVVSNIQLRESENKINTILLNERYSDDDILIYHGNALLNTKKSKLQKEIKSLKSKFGAVYIIPGDKDWEDLNSKKLKSLSDYLKEKNKYEVILPKNACGAVEVKDISDNLSIVFIDSEWYFADWSEDRSLNKKCKISSRTEFWDELNGALGGLKAKQVILFARSPVFRNDAIGGHLSIKQHLFPLPILGTMINDTKNYLSPNINIYSPLYQQYIFRMKQILEDHPKVTMVTSDAQVNSIHTYKNNFQINVNSSKDMKRSHSDRNIIYQDNDASILLLSTQSEEVTAKFLSLEHGTEKYNITVLKGKPFLYNPSEFINFNPSVLDKKVTTKIRPDKDRVDLSTFIFGGLNKRLYNLEVNVDQLNLNNEKGGLVPLRLGGGKQTNSMRLGDIDGNVYAVRSLKKNPKKALPPGLKSTQLNRIMENFFMAADPLAFLTTPTLDSAANVYYLTPRLVYLTRQPGLTIYNDQIGNELVLFRERADEAWPDKKSFGNSDNIISSSAMLKEIVNNKGSADSEMFLRARLLDIILNDWDRHQDQWRWAEGNGENRNKYYPIARDRDQVYSNFDGLFMALFKPYVTNLLQLNKFDNNVSKNQIRWMHWKSSVLDNLILSELNESQWQAQTDYIQTAITDNIIKKATDKLPESYIEQKANIRSNLGSRMKEIQQTSRNFRSELLELALVRGSMKKDSLVISQTDDMVSIDMYLNYRSKKNKSKRSYQYNKHETKAIWIYGLEGDDKFVMQGDRSNDIDITIIGGHNGDEYISNGNYRNITIIDDEPTEEVKSTTSTSYRFNTNKEVNVLTVFDLTPKYKFFIPKLNYNTDDGLTIGGSNTWINHGFKSVTTNTLSADYLTGRNSSLVSYQYRKDDKLSQESFYLNARWSGIRRQLNFYGGNGSMNNNNDNFYQVAISDMRLELGKIKNINSTTSISGGLYAWSAKVEETVDRFVSQSELVNEEIFDREYFTGGKINLTLQNSNSPLRPTRLGRVSLNADYKYAIISKRSNILIDFEYDYYKPLIGEDRLLVSSKIKVGHLFGPYNLYEGYQLGGVQFLRGYRNGRFTGRSIVAQNINFQLKVADYFFSRGALCSSGISGGFDHGRVWSDIDISEAWQYSYGGGLWISPLNAAVISAGVYKGSEDYQLRVLFNWQF